MNAPARRGHSSSVTPKLAVHQHYTETRHSSWSAAMCAANHAVQLMSHVSTAAAMTTRQTSCVPVQRIPVASLGSCQTHLVVEEAMKPRDAGCTTVTPLRRPQHAHTCLDEAHRRFRRARHRADNHAPGQPNGTKSLATTIPSPPGYHSPRIITVSPSSHSQMGRAGTLLWWRSINSPGINAQLPLLPRPGIARPFAFYLWLRLSPAIVVTERGHDGRIKTTPTHDAPGPKPLHFRLSTLRADSRIRH